MEIDPDSCRLARNERSKLGHKNLGCDASEEAILFIPTSEEGNLCSTQAAYT